MIINFLKNELLLQKFIGHPRPITEEDMPIGCVKSKMEKYGKQLTNVFKMGI